VRGAFEPLLQALLIAVDLLEEDHYVIDRTRILLSHIFKLNHQPFEFAFLVYTPHNSSIAARDQLVLMLLEACLIYADTHRLNVHLLCELPWLIGWIFAFLRSIPLEALLLSHFAYLVKCLQRTSLSRQTERRGLGLTVGSLEPCCTHIL